MITHISQTLHHYSFSFNTNCQSQFLHYIWHIAHFTQAKENTKTCCFTTATNTTLCYRFTGYTTGCINLTRMHSRISIQYPGHFSFTGSIIRCRYISAGADKIFLDQFSCIATGDFFQFVRRIFFWIDLDTTFTTTKRNIYNGTFVSHQCSKGHHFILVYFGSKTDTTFAGCFVMGVLYTVGFNHFNASIISF